MDEYIDTVKIKNKTYAIHDKDALKKEHFSELTEIEDRNSVEECVEKCNAIIRKLKGEE